jgi:uncharacterized phiE125 gp8 family phage protein
MEFQTMIVTEETGVPLAALPMAELRAQLRLGTGFADDGMQDGLLEAHLRGALAAIEGRTGKAVIGRRFRLRLDDWRDAAAQALPLAPVSAVVSVTVFDAAGTGTPVAADRWRLVPDTHRPRLAAAGVTLPAVPYGGRAEVVFDAGFGAWAAVPRDLGLAVLMLAAHRYEFRHDGGGQGMPAAILDLIGRWRTVRTIAGGGA